MVAGSNQVLALELFLFLNLVLLDYLHLLHVQHLNIALVLSNHHIVLTVLHQSFHLFFRKQHLDFLEAPISNGYTVPPSEYVVVRQFQRSE